MINECTRVVLITGGSSGIGAAIAARFLDAGYGVVTMNRSETGPPASKHADRLVQLAGDVRSIKDNRRAVAAAIDRFGRLDVFVGNAGVYDHRRAFGTYSEEELGAAFDELFAVNVKGYLLGARAAAAELAKTKGCIIFTSSISGAFAGFGGTLYVAAKHAINGLTRQLALELAPSIRVNAVAPGYVPTQLRGLESMAQQATIASGPAEAGMPLGVFGRPEDFAEAYLFLASNACARMATGTILQLDGGSSLIGGTAPRASEA